MKLYEIDFGGRILSVKVDSYMRTGLGDDGSDIEEGVELSYYDVKHQGQNFDPSVKTTRRFANETDGRALLFDTRPATVARKYLKKVFPGMKIKKVLI
jgi:hypothetical protein